MYEMGEQELTAVAKVITSGQLFRYRGGEGGQCDQFETELAKKLGCRYTLITSSGTGALTCALIGCGIGPGDEVIVPAYTFMATALAVLAAGAIPIIAEIDESLTLDPQDVAAKITDRTRAILPVHMMGLPNSMDALTTLAQKRDLIIVEDACQAVGGAYKGRRLGTIGKAGAFSFNHFKIIACGEGGAVLTSDRLVYEGALIRHDGGCAFRNHAGAMTTPIFAGQNIRASEIMGAIMRVQLKRLDGILKKLRTRKKAMVATLAGGRGYTLAPVNCTDGDCAVTTAIQFDSPARMRAAQEALKGAGLGGASSPIDSGIHVYSNWDPILAKRAAHHAALSPYNMTDRSYTYSKDMCPRTTDILSRTLFLGVNIRATPAQSASRAAHIRNVFESL